MNQFVTKLVLPGNGLGDRGALAIARALASSSVTSLDISDNGVTGIGAVAVAEALEVGGDPGTDFSARHQSILNLARVRILHEYDVNSLEPLEGGCSGNRYDHLLSDGGLIESVDF